MAYNPFPGDKDFEYLGMDAKVLNEQRSVPFDGKKNTWIPDAKEGFVRAEIESTKGEEVTVITDKGEVGQQAKKKKEREEKKVGGEGLGRIREIG